MEIRKIIATTNSIESLNARYRRAVRARGHFPTDQAALKCLYLARKKATADVLLAAASGFAKDCRDRETKPQFIVYPAKWLDEERWADQTPLAPQKRSRYATKELLGD